MQAADTSHAPPPNVVHTGGDEACRREMGGMPGTSASSCGDTNDCDSADYDDMMGGRDAPAASGSPESPHGAPAPHGAPGSRAPTRNYRATMTPLEQAFVKPTIDEPELFWCRVCDIKFLKRFAMHHLSTSHRLAPASIEHWCVVADGLALLQCDCMQLESAFRELPSKRQRDTVGMPRVRSPAHGDWRAAAPAAARTPTRPSAAPSSAPTPTASAASAAAPSTESREHPLLSYEPMPPRTRRLLSPGAKDYAVRQAVAATNARGCRPSTHWYHAELWRAGIAHGQWDAATNPEGIRAHCRKELARMGL
jgi:hypothetical protein